MTLHRTSGWAHPPGGQPPCMWRSHSAAVTTTSVDKQQPLGTIMDRWAEARATATALEDT